MLEPFSFCMVHERHHLPSLSLLRIAPQRNAAVLFGIITCFHSLVDIQYIESSTLSIRLLSFLWEKKTLSKPFFSLSS